MNFFGTQTDTESDVLTQTREEENHELVLYNDDVNTFDYVIESLITVCEHTLEQAEQCTILVHFKGKCGVKSGSFKELRPRCEALLERGLTAKIH